MVLPFARGGASPHSMHWFLFLGKGTVTSNIERNWWIAVLMFVGMSFARGYNHMALSSYAEAHLENIRPLSRGQLIGPGIVGALLYLFVLVLVIHPFVSKGLYLPLVVVGAIGGTGLLGLATRSTKWLL